MLGANPGRPDPEVRQHRSAVARRAVSFRNRQSRGDGSAKREPIGRLAGPGEARAIPTGRYKAMADAGTPGRAALTDQPRDGVLSGGITPCCLISASRWEAKSGISSSSMI